MKPSRSRRATSAAEPAAVLYAFARRPRAFPGAVWNPARLYTSQQAARVGLRLDTDARALRSICVRIAASELDFAATRAWLDARLVPLEPR